MRGLITELEEEYAEMFLCDLGIQCRTARRLLKPLAEQFSSQPQHSFLLLVGLSGGDGDLSEASSTVLRGRVEDLNYKAEKVSVKVEIFMKLSGILHVGVDVEGDQSGGGVPGVGGRPRLHTEEPESPAARQGGPGQPQIRPRSGITQDEKRVKIIRNLIQTNL